MRPVFFALGPFKLYGYGAVIVLGAVFTFWFLYRRQDKVGFRSDDDFWLFVNVVLVSGWVGGRVLYLIEYTRWFSAEFWRAAFAFSSGFSVLGSFVGAPLGIWLFCRARNVPFLRLFDTVCVMAPFWHVFGRLGCFLAGCCHGRPTDVPWAVVFTDPRAMVPPEWLGVPLHPAQLYEAFGNACIAAALYALLRRSETKAPGLVAAAYFAAYGVERFFLEFYRGDTVPLAFGLTAGQGLGLGLVAASLTMLGWRAACSRPS